MGLVLGNARPPCRYNVKWGGTNPKIMTLGSPNSKTKNIYGVYTYEYTCVPVYIIPGIMKKRRIPGSVPPKTALSVCRNVHGSK